jgi:Ca2+-binding EF-hand superfamily protein
MFDKDKSGYINSIEFQNVLSALDIHLTREAYEQILREGDKDSKLGVEVLEVFIVNCILLFEKTPEILVSMNFA